VATETGTEATRCVTTPPPWGELVDIVNGHLWLPHAAVTLSEPAKREWLVVYRYDHRDTARVIGPMAVSGEQ